MTDLLNALFRWLTPLWEMSVTAAYAAAVVIVLRLLLKKRAPRQVLCLLWLVVFARLLIPVSLESPLSIVPGALPGQEHLMEQAPAGPVAGNPVTPSAPQSPVQNQPQYQPGNGAVTPVTGNKNPSLSVPEDVSPTVPAQSAPAPFPWQAVLAGVWLAGAAALGVYALASWLRLHRRLFDAIRVEDGVWEHPAVASPFILGVFRPRIYLPAGLTGQQRQFILCHERAHLRRCDHIVKPMCWAALALHWFNPLAWAAFLLMSRDIEAACDEAVVRQLGSGVKADYSDTLLALATGRRFPAPCPLAFDEGDAKGRIRNVLSYRRPAFWAIALSVAAAALAAVCLLTDPVAAKGSEGDPDPDPSFDPNVSATLPPSSLADDLLDLWMKELLDGERTFSSAYSDQTYSINDLKLFLFGDAQAHTTLDFELAILDLDRDGVNELIFSFIVDNNYLSSNLGYLILHRQGDTVHSYNPYPRGFTNLKADGTFYWYDTAVMGGIATISFPDGINYETENISWFDNRDGENYFVDGQKATRAEFYAAYDIQDAKPEPTWYVYRGGELSVKSPIPAIADSIGVPVPNFLNEEQRTLYARALSLYSRLFSASGANVDPEGYAAAGYAKYNGLYYHPTDAYGTWDEFEQTVLSVFTPDFWAAKNKDVLFVNANGTVYYLDYGRGSGGYNENFPESFRLVERTDDTVSFIMTGYYSDYLGIPADRREAWLAEGWEYTIEFPMRMVKTADGWRFDEFYNARTDNGVPPFETRQIPNPDAPSLRFDEVYTIDAAAPLDAPIVDPNGGIPDDPSQWYKVAELPGDMIWMFSRNYGMDTLLRWGGSLYKVFNRTAHTSYGILPQLKKLGGTDTYGPLAVISNVDKGTGVYIDELVLYDLDAAGPAMDYTHDWSPLADNFNGNVSYRYDKDARTLTYTYQGQTVKAVIDPDAEYRLKMERESIRLCVTGELVYYRFDQTNDGDITIELPVGLYVGDEAVPLSIPGWVSWTLRFNGSGFDTVSGSCRLGVYAE